MKDGQWPRVVVQLPIFNQQHVVERLVDAAAALDYPPDRLEIQVLDDSTDRTTELAEARAAWHRSPGRLRGLKIPRRKACRFESGPGHHIQKPDCYFVEQSGFFLLGFFVLGFSALLALGQPVSSIYFTVVIDFNRHLGAHGPAQRGHAFALQFVVDLHTLTTA